MAAGEGLALRLIAMRLQDTTDRTELYTALARENLLLDAGEAAEPTLLLWRGPKAVVMGKNQNPWRECNLEVVRDKGLSLARRVSGGGAVYHDPGNLNLSWVLPRAEYNAAQVRRILIRALDQLGLKAEEGTGGGVRVGRHKVSGAAYCYRREHVLHHGTLLIDADLGTLRAALAPPRMRMRTHAVASIPARVANLADLRPGVDLKAAKEAYLAEAEREFGSATALQDLEPDGPEALDEAARLADPAWIRGQTPAFQAEVAVEGHGTLAFRVRKGLVTELQWNGGPLEIPPELPFTTAGFAAVARTLGINADLLTAACDAQGWLLESI